MKRLGLSALVALALCLPSTALADSDGYYCTGPGYLAYQFGKGPGSIGPHRLYVISTRGPKGIPAPAVWDLPQFQVHGMLCGEGWVDIASFTTVYRITLDEKQRPVRYEARGPLDKPIPQDFIHSQLQNLGASGAGRALVRPIRVSLGTTPLGGEYRLEVTAKAVQPVKSCVLSVKSRVVEIDALGREVSERIVFEGRGHRECGE